MRRYEVGTYIFSADGTKVASGGYTGLVCPPLDKKSAPTPFMEQHWNKKGDLSDTGFGSLYQWMGLVLDNPLDEQSHTRVIKVPIKKGGMGPATIVVNQLFPAGLELFAGLMTCELFQTPNDTHLVGVARYKNKAFMDAGAPKAQKLVGELKAYVGGAPSTTGGGVRWSFAGKVAHEDLYTQMRVTEITLKPSLALEDLRMILDSPEVTEGMQTLEGLIICEIVVVDNTMLVCTKYDSLKNLETSAAKTTKTFAPLKEFIVGAPKLMQGCRVFTYEDNHVVSTGIDSPWRGNVGADE
jgi:hypothetical protein